MTSKEIALPVGPFFCGGARGRFHFLSGQVAQVPATGSLLVGDVTAQAEQIIRNLQAVLRTAGKSFCGVVRVGVYLTDIKDFAQLNAVYARQFDAILLFQGATVPLLLAGLSLRGHLDGGLLWFAFGLIVSLIVALYNAWVLLVEIVR